MVLITFPNSQCGFGGGVGLVTKSYLTLAAPWTLACQVPLLMGFPKQEYWSGLPFPSPADLPDPGIKPQSPVGSLLNCGHILYRFSHQGNPLANAGDEMQVQSLVGKIPWWRKW